LRETSKRAIKTDERPQAPWGAFPLAELAIFAGLVILAIGFFGGSPTALAVGFTLGALGGLEVSVREHFAGYRSHTTLLAGTVFVVLIGALLLLAKLALPIAVAIGAAGFVVAFLALRRAFQRASGGLSFRAGRLR
jgi:uncharacterized integral membrane protein